MVRREAGRQCGVRHLEVALLAGTAGVTVRERYKPVARGSGDRVAVGAADGEALRKPDRTFCTALYRLHGTGLLPAFAQRTCSYAWQHTACRACSAYPQWVVALTTAWPIVPPAVEAKDDQLHTTIAA